MDEECDDIIVAVTICVAFDVSSVIKFVEELPGAAVLLGVFSDVFRNDEVLRKLADVSIVME